ncbi:PREDICTED: uncharacterized protein LOC105361768 [Ceratosolen solmsi marchali]|uniref:Uncharacterized protein LOC105361768 n=1 Tax=Ceratosolen solmsi marchali TaxID=326594 RepID=A0AAJ6YFY2_9HYME|nr:PREDICTED: uncharacterized protein LOC105361768 [Ceratosolen solmsi marchali]
MRKNLAAALQTDVTTDDEWEKILKLPGLILVDIYSEWSGPCTSMISVLKRIKIELGDDNLNYATAKCDNITSLSRFRGKSEPVWMFIREGKMINFMFGANCPKLVELLTKEIKRLHTNHPPEYSLPVNELCPKEIERVKIYEEARAIEEAERCIREEAINRRKYEAELQHLIDSLCYESCVILFPWALKDEEGKIIDNDASPVFAELIHKLSGLYRIEQTVQVTFDEESCDYLIKESEFEITELTKKLLLDGTCVCLRLKINNKSSNKDIDTDLMDILFGEPVIPPTIDELAEGCFVERNLPSLSNLTRDSASMMSSDDKQLTLTTIWIPFNARNRAVVFRALFPKYIESTYPYIDPTYVIPKTLFKYDSPRRKELQVVLETYKSEVLHFGVFKQDRLPKPKLIAVSIEQFDNEVKEKTSYEVFICVIQKLNNEAFLSFAGIGPYHVSENEEKAEEEMVQYFPNANKN